jgi:hypothetical protein
MMALVFCMLFANCAATIDAAHMKAYYGGDSTASANGATGTAAPVARVQKPAPTFNETAVVNGEFKTVSLDQFRGKYFVLFFYPLDFTFVCPTEIIGFSDRATEFTKIGCNVAAGKCIVEQREREREREREKESENLKKNLKKNMKTIE